MRKNHHSYDSCAFTAVLMILLLLISTKGTYADFDQNAFDYVHADYNNPIIDWKSIDYAQIPPNRYKDLPYDKIDYAAQGLQFDQLDTTQLTLKGLHKYMADVGCSRCVTAPEYANYRLLHYRSDGLDHMGYTIDFATYPSGTIFTIDARGRILAKVAGEAGVEIAPRTTEKVVVQTHAKDSVHTRESAQAGTQATLKGAVEMENGRVTVLEPASKITQGTTILEAAEKAVQISDAAKWRELYGVQQDINKAYQVSPAWNGQKQQLVALRDALKNDLGIIGDIPTDKIIAQLQNMGAYSGTSATAAGNGPTLTVNGVTFGTRNGQVGAMQNNGAVLARISGTVQMGNGAKLFVDNGRITADATDAILHGPVTASSTLAAGTMLQHDPASSTLSLVRNGVTLVSVGSDALGAETLFGLQPDIAEDLGSVLGELVDDNIELTLEGKRSLSYQRYLYRKYISRAKTDYPVARPTLNAPHVSGTAVDAQNFNALSAEQQQKVVATFKQHGWEWGGDFSIPDRIHFQKTR